MQLTQLNQKLKTDIKKNTFLKTQLEILLNNWCVQKINNEFIFFKHFVSNKKGLIYQLILSGNDYDGIYEFEIFGHDLKINNVVSGNDVVMVVNSLSNCSLAIFEKGEKKNSFVESQYINNEYFKKDVLKHIDVFDIANINMNNNENKIMSVKQLKSNISQLFNSNKIKSIQLIQKKQQYTISYIDLGPENFKKELLTKEYVTLEEYALFTSQNIKLYSKIYKDMKKVKMF